MAEGRDILRGFLAVPVDLHPSQNLLEPALEIANGIDRSVYDSLYLALAHLQNCRMVTADRRLHDVVHTGPFADSIRWVEDEL